MSVRLPRIGQDPLTISLWDFSWYTMTGPDEAFEDLDSRLDEAVERGFNAIRICAMPILLFGDLHDSFGAEPWRRLRFSGLGKIGQRTRWYSFNGGKAFDGRARLAALLLACKARGIAVILSSWEFQQTGSFVSDPVLRAALAGIGADERFSALVRAWLALLDQLSREGLTDVVSYVELHNEIEFGRLAELSPDPTDISRTLEALKPHIEDALAQLRAGWPDMLFASSHTLGRPYGKDLMAQNVQVAHFHLYVDGVVQELMSEAALDDFSCTFPNSFVSSLLRADAPPFDEWTLSAGEEDRLMGNPVGLRLLYLHDWVDADAWDRSLYDRWGGHRISMQRQIDERLGEVAQIARKRGIPALIGEGYVGYTPLAAGFEEGPIGKGLAERAIKRAAALGFAGICPCSNCAPHHPFWQDLEWQRRWNGFFMSSTGICQDRFRQDLPN